jgi:uncharacterized protein YqiB (DUF1249 family)
MELYEQNYMLVRLLVPELRSLRSDTYVSVPTIAMDSTGLNPKVPMADRLDDSSEPADDTLQEILSGPIPLELSQLCHERYTTTFNLTYRFTSCSGKPREPDLLIRLYHDARACEVLSGLVPGLRREVRRTRDLAEGPRLNRFLNKWLSYCLRQGHSFGPQTANQPAVRKLAIDAGLLISADSVD